MQNNAEGAAEAFQVLSKAFEAVGTTEARRMYDEQRSLQSPVVGGAFDLLIELQLPIDLFNYGKLALFFQLA